MVAGALGAIARGVVLRRGALTEASCPAFVTRSDGDHLARASASRRRAAATSGRRRSLWSPGGARAPRGQADPGGAHRASDAGPLSSSWRYTSLGGPRSSSTSGSPVPRDAAIHVAALPRQAGVRWCCMPTFKRGGSGSAFSAQMDLEPLIPSTPRSPSPRCRGSRTFRGESCDELRLICGGCMPVTHRKFPRGPLHAATTRRALPLQILQQFRVADFEQLLLRSFVARFRTSPRSASLPLVTSFARLGAEPPQEYRPRTTPGRAVGFGHRGAAANRASAARRRVFLVLLLRHISARPTSCRAAGSLLPAPFTRRTSSVVRPPHRLACHPHVLVHVRVRSARVPLARRAARRPRAAAPPTRGCVSSSNRPARAARASALPRAARSSPARSPPAPRSAPPPAPPAGAAARTRRRSREPPPRRVVHAAQGASRSRRSNAEAVASVDAARSRLALSTRLARASSMRSSSSARSRSPRGTASPSTRRAPAARLPRTGRSSSDIIEPRARSSRSRSLFSMTLPPQPGDVQQRRGQAAADATPARDASRWITSSRRDGRLSRRASLTSPNRRSRFVDRVERFE